MFEFLTRTKIIPNAHRDLIHDPAFPYTFTAELAWPQGMLLLNVALFGGVERVVIRGKGLWSLNRVIKRCDDLRTHPRLLRYTLTGPNGVILEQHPKPAAQEAA